MSNIKDVAKLAGVSIATVSHVINETRFVSEETKAKVRRAMEELEFTPNISAKSMRTQKTKTVGLAIPILVNEADCVFFMQIARGAESVLKAKGYFMFLSNTDDKLEREIEEIKNFNSRQIDGLIIAPATGDHRFINEMVKNYPVVFVDRRPTGLENVECVVSDAMAGSRSAINQVIAMGHTKIAILCGFLGKRSNADERFEGYRKALLEHKIPLNSEYVMECEASIEDGYAMTEKMLSNHHVTHLFYASNIMAMGGMQYIQKHHIRVPQDLSITVYDDYDWTHIYSPELTVIRQHAYELGKKSAEIMLARMDNEPMPKRGKEYRLPTEVIVRESWASAKKEG